MFNILADATNFGRYFWISTESRHVPELSPGGDPRKSCLSVRRVGRNNVEATSVEQGGWPVCNTEILSRPSELLGFIFRKLKAYLGFQIIRSSLCI